MHDAMESARAPGRGTFSKDVSAMQCHQPLTPLHLPHELAKKTTSPMPRHQENASGKGVCQKALFVKLRDDQ